MFREGGEETTTMEGKTGQGRNKTNIDKIYKHKVQSP